MSIQYPKKDRGGTNPVGPEQIHIFRDPPKSAYTRKKETVNIADVMYMIRPDDANSDPTRINENILYIARGKNPMVEVDYGNHSAASMNTSLDNRQASNPYKIEVVRPPLFPAETRVPLSAPRIHQNYSITTNSGITPQLVDSRIDKQKVKNITNVRKAVTAGRPTVGLRMETPKELDTSFAINPNKTPYSMVSGMSSALDKNNTMLSEIVNRTKETILKSMGTNFSVYVYDNKNNALVNVQSNIKDKENMMINATRGMPIIINRNDGVLYNIKDYQWNVVNTNMGTEALVITPNNREIHLDRDLQLFAVTSAMSSELNSNNNMNRNVQLDDRDKYSIATNFANNLSDTTQNRNIELKDKEFNYASNTNISTQFNKRNDVQYNREHTMSVSGSNGVTPISLLGYNENLTRETQNNIELHKLSNFGNYEDRTTRQLANTNIPVMPKTLKESNSYNKTIQEMNMRQFTK
jgi:hypothetical protein